MGTDSGEKLRRLTGLEDIVLCAQTEALFQAGAILFAGDEKDGCVLTSGIFSYLPAYGQPVAPAGYAQKSKLAAGLLGIFLGCFGVHNFYLGNTGKAVAQLLLTVIGWILIIGPAVAGIWGLVEGILILCSHYGSQWHRDAQGVELQD